MGEDIFLTLWDPDRTDSQLLEACLGTLRSDRAKVERYERGGRLRGVGVLRHPLCPPDTTGVFWPARSGGGKGGLVQITLPIDWFEEHGWSPWLEAVGRLLAGVRPQLMVCPILWSADQLLDPPPELAATLFAVGWVDPTRLTEQQRKGLERALRDGGLGREVAGGWWWSTDPERDPLGQGVPPEEVDALGARLASAFTGKYVETVPVESVTVLPANNRELWFWAVDRDDSRLLDAVSGWARGHGYDDEEQVSFGSNGLPGWLPVIVSLGPDADPAEALAPLRHAIVEVRPAWAALQPEAGLAVPGLDIEAPATGVLHNMWVAHDWVGDRLVRLLEILGGAHREELAGGTLLLTTPEVLPGGDFAAWCHDRAARWDRLVDAAVVLAEAARASRPPP